MISVIPSLKNLKCLVFSYLFSTSVENQEISFHCFKCLYKMVLVYRYRGGSAWSVAFEIGFFLIKGKTSQYKSISKKRIFIM